MAVRHVAAGGVESLQVPQENLEVSQPPDPRSYDPAINWFAWILPSYLPPGQYSLPRGSGRGRMTMGARGGGGG